MLEEPTLPYRETNVTKGNHGIELRQMGEPVCKVPTAWAIQNPEAFGRLVLTAVFGNRTGHPYREGG